MKKIPEYDALEQRIRKMADSLEPPSSLSPEKLLQKLPDRQPVRQFSVIRKYTPAIAMAACLLVVIAGSAVLRNFAGEPMISTEPDTSVSSKTESDPEPSENLTETESSPPEEPSSQPAESSEQAKEPPVASNDLPTMKQPAESSDEIVSSSSEPAAPEVSEPQEPEKESVSEETSENSIEGPPGAIHLDYPGLQEQESIEGYRDIYSVMAEMQRNVLQDSFNVPNNLMIASVNIEPVSTVGVETGDVVVGNGKTLCTLSYQDDSPTVLLYKLDGKNSTFASELTPKFDLPEIPGMHISYVAPSELLLDDDILIVAGKAYYWSDQSSIQQDITVFSFYDIHNPQYPVYRSTLCQDGRLSAAYVQDGMLSFITEYTVPTHDSFDETDLNSYLPHAYQNGFTVIPRRSQILIGEDANAPVYTTLGTVDLSDPSAFVDTFCYLGETDGLYINPDFTCLVRNQIDSAQMALVSFEMDASGIELLGQCSLDGSLLGEIYLLPQNKGIAVTIQSKESVPSLYLFNKKLEAQSCMENFAPVQTVASVEYQDMKAYYRNAQGSLIAAIDFTQVRKPSSTSWNTYSERNPQSVCFGNQILEFSYTYQDDGTASGVTLQILDLEGQELSSVFLEGELYIPAMYDQEVLFTDERTGLIGFGVTRYGNEALGTNTQYTYQLYRYSANTGLTLVTEQLLYSAENVNSMPEFETGYLYRQNFYIALPDKILVLDWYKGDLLAEVVASKQ